MQQTVDAKTTLDILNQDQHLVHSFADLNALKNEGARTVITKADGAHVFDSEGRRFLDGIGGLWCVNVGHGRREIIDAIAHQLQELDYYSTFYNLTHPKAAALAEKVAYMAPGPLNHVYFANSGSAANDSAIRILHYYYNRLGKPNKKKILSRIGAYHGSTHMAIAMTTPEYRDGWDSADELVEFLSCPNPYRAPDNQDANAFLDFLADEMVEKIEHIGAENIACFIAEPILGAGGVIVPPEGYHLRTRAICDQYDIKYISDEVVTAFARLGHMFASHAVFNIQPDIITSAKGLTSGYQPLSATIISEEIHDVIGGPGARFLHGMTYSGHPAGCAAALANIAIMENEALCQQVQRTGPQFETALRSLNALDIVGEVRGSHFMMGIEFVADKSSKTTFDADVGIGARVADHAQSRGLIVRPLGHMAVLSPPLILTAADIDEITSILADCIKATTDDLKREHVL